MIKKVGIIITILLVIIIIISLLIFGYFKFIGLESKTPKEEKSWYSIENKKYMERNVFILTPSDNEPSEKVILYLHGGAYVGEIENEHWNFVEKLIKDTNNTIILPDYPLAPKYTYKDVFNMIEPLYKESLKLAGIAYAGNDGINNYLVNPIDGDLSKLKNLTIFTGTYDILNPDVHILKEKAQNQGINIDAKEYEKAGHIWIVNQKGDKELIEKAYKDLLEVVNY